MKFCSKCKQSKPAEEYHKDSSSKDGLAYYCRVCANSSARKHHKKRSSDKFWADSRRQYQKTQVRESKLQAIDYLGGCCFDCKKVYPPYVYDIHHLDGSKKLDNPSRLLRGNWEIAKLELDKCVLLCANCHRERHFNE